MSGPGIARVLCPLNEQEFKIAAPFAQDHGDRGMGTPAGSVFPGLLPVVQQS
jgi:hypothetical protein